MQYSVHFLKSVVNTNKTVHGV